jgi:hypothetical protein
MWAMGFTHTGTEIHVISSETTATAVPKFHVNNLLLCIVCTAAAAIQIVMYVRCFSESSSYWCTRKTNTHTRQAGYTD